MDVSDAFAKLREQILAYDNPESDAERTGGLNLVNTTNLSFFQAPQKSEVFRLKAVFLDSLGARSKSNRAYCHAVQICPSYARAWSSWGGLCASLGRLAERQHEIEASKSEDSESNEVRWVSGQSTSYVFNMSHQTCAMHDTGKTRSVSEESCTVSCPGNRLLF